MSVWVVDDVEDEDAGKDDSIGRSSEIKYKLKRRHWAIILLMFNFHTTWETRSKGD